MAYPGSSYAPPASSYGAPNNYAGTGYASSSYDKPSSYPNPMQQHHQYSPQQQLYVNDSMLVSVCW